MSWVMSYMVPGHGSNWCASRVVSCRGVPEGLLPELIQSRCIDATRRSANSDTYNKPQPKRSAQEAVLSCGGRGRSAPMDA
jgi:hypothetical protein